MFSESGFEIPRSKDHRGDLIYARGKSKFAVTLIQIGHELKSTKEIMTITHTENQHTRKTSHQENNDFTKHT